MLFKWTPDFVPNKIFVFGCGGTGSRVVPLVSQFIKSCPWAINPHIILVDFDEVEEKNLSRQNFVASDVGKNKAVVLAGRYSKAFNVMITPIVDKVTKDPRNESEQESTEVFTNLLKYEGNIANNIFILCVDSAEARRDIVALIVALIGSQSRNIIIDSGNENSFGQVTVSGIYGIDPSQAILHNLKKDTPVVCDLPYIPMNPHYYDGMVSSATASCAELDQTMCINALMAVNIFSIVQNIYYVKPISYFRIDISMQFGAIPQYIDIKYLQEASVLRPQKEFTRNISRIIRTDTFSNTLSKAYGDQCAFEDSLKPKPEKSEEPKVEEKEKKKRPSGPDMVIVDEVLTSLPTIIGSSSPAGTLDIETLVIQRPGRVALG